MNINLSIIDSPSRHSDAASSSTVGHVHCIDTPITSNTPVQPKPASRPASTTMLLALTTLSNNQSELPAIERTLPLAERFHREIIGRAGRGKKINCPELTGQDEHGHYLRGRHQHAHVLPLDLDNDGHLDHILIHAPMGLGVTAQTAIRTMKQSSSQCGVTDLRVALVGRGDLNSLHALPGSFRTATQKLLSPIDACQSWISVTPFVAPRYLKRRGKNNLPGQVNAELESRGLPQATEIEILPWESDNFKLRHFVQIRSGDKSTPATLCVCN